MAVCTSEYKAKRSATEPVTAFTRRLTGPPCSIAASWHLKGFYFIILYLPTHSSSVAILKKDEILLWLKTPTFAAYSPRGFLLRIISFGPFCYLQPQFSLSSCGFQPGMAARNCRQRKGRHTRKPSQMGHGRRQVRQRSSGSKHI